MEPGWCPDCDTRHASDASCPGPLLATGDERPGWRVTVETPSGIEAVGILVAPSGHRWRARILTYPNVLWTVPGGLRSMKFVAPSPQEAEAKAVEYVGAHFAERGWLRRDGLVVPPVSRVAAEAVASAASSGGPAPRKLRSFPVRFGSVAPSLDGVTANVSATGVFIATLRPLDAGAPIRIRLELEEDSRVTLRGQVIWRRERLEVGRPSGMGIRLVDPPEIYVRAVRALA